MGAFQSTITRDRVIRADLPESRPLAGSAGSDLDPDSS
jgi:hypothetical protein